MPLQFPTFETWFSESWPALLADAKASGFVFTSGAPMADASWDRVAAFVAWRLLQPPPCPVAPPPCPVPA